MTEQSGPHPLAVFLLIMAAIAAVIGGAMGVQRASECHRIGAAHGLVAHYSPPSTCTAVVLGTEMTVATW